MISQSVKQMRKFTITFNDLHIPRPMPVVLTIFCTKLAGTRSSIEHENKVHEGENR